MKQSLIILLTILSFLFQKNIFSQFEVYNYFQGDMPAINYNDQIGGYVLPSEGTLKVLFIFAKFPDDGYTGYSKWPLGGDPQNYTTWLDETWTGNPTTGSLTDYFNQMSLGKLHFIGKEVSVTTLHTRQWYIDNGKKRYEIHKEIIQQQLDPTWDFGQFDNWTKTYDPNSQWYIHTNMPDGKVEFICVVWRNIAMEFDSETRDDIMEDLNMGWYGSLGKGLNYTVDN